MWEAFAIHLECGEGICSVDLDVMSNTLLLPLLSLRITSLLVVRSLPVSCHDGSCQNPSTPHLCDVISGSVEGTDATRVMPIWMICHEPSNHSLLGNKSRCTMGSSRGTVLPWWSIQPYDLLLQIPAARPIYKPWDRSVWSLCPRIVGVMRDPFRLQRWRFAVAVECVMTVYYIFHEEIWVMFPWAIWTMPLIFGIESVYIRKSHGTLRQTSCCIARNWWQ